MPCVISQWVYHPLWAAVFSFVQVFILWSLNFIAIELENPFGRDVNDLDGRALQADMNDRLLLIVQPHQKAIPFLLPSAVDFITSGWCRETTPDSPHGRSFRQCWVDATRSFTSETNACASDQICGRRHRRPSQGSRSSRCSGSSIATHPQASLGVACAAHSSQKKAFGTESSMNSSALDAYDSNSDDTAVFSAEVQETPTLASIERLVIAHQGTAKTFPKSSVMTQPTSPNSDVLLTQITGTPPRTEFVETPSGACQIVQ